MKEDIKETVENFRIILPKVGKYIFIFTLTYVFIKIYLDILFTEILVDDFKESWIPFILDTVLFYILFTPYLCGLTYLFEKVLNDQPYDVKVYLKTEWKAQFKFLVTFFLSTFFLFTIVYFVYTIIGIVILSMLFLSMFHVLVNNSSLVKALIFSIKNIKKVFLKSIQFIVIYFLIFLIGSLITFLFLNRITHPKLAEYILLLPNYLVFSIVYFGYYLLYKKIEKGNIN